ncbi:DUF91 domain-containing protein [Cryobacterium lactosi]|uniref:DUF91 domain-containing protein n=1 Tax=Cryobacterium lactosi TaxID=1259202 RepID=A0A4R9BPP8_9MICO|nr:endonuclease NucS domain-containing protein [Cryobacterium lactosi]TFD88594.1 DUF91 domain-containing protein [Cryobacterium lactosi]
MPLYRYSAAKIEPLLRTTLAAEQIREREDLQRLLMQRIDVISEDLLVITEEYSLFKDSRRRIDILAIDRMGTLVVIELKRTEDGGHMELQSLRYAAMVSTVTLDHLVETFADAQSLPLTEARETILNWLIEPTDELPNHVRIILVSADFSTEITSTVLWLNENYNTDISCFRLVAYRLGADVLLDVQQIIPLPEAKVFQIQQRQKGAAATGVIAAGRDFTRYNLQINGEQFLNVSKQSAVKSAMQTLFAAGVPLVDIQSATQPARWLGVHPAPDESVEDAFVREHPNRSSSHRWFDLGVIDDGTTWVTPRFGGTSTEAMLDGLRKVGEPFVSLSWSRLAPEQVGLQV